MSVLIAKVNEIIEGYRKLKLQEMIYLGMGENLRVLIEDRGKTKTNPKKLDTSIAIYRSQTNIQMYKVKDAYEKLYKLIITIGWADKLYLAYLHTTDKICRDTCEMFYDVLNVVKEKHWRYMSV